MLLSFKEYKADQSQIVSQYQWYINCSSFPASINRINLSSLEIDFSWEFPTQISVEILMILPNNHIFGQIFDNDLLDRQHLFISDEKFSKIKIIETAIINNSIRSEICACFYDDSIFAIEKDVDFVRGDRFPPELKRYLIYQDMWVHLPRLPFNYPNSCIGFNQQIIIIGEAPGLWIYDITLSSYSHHLPIRKFEKKANQMLFKYERKLYLLIFSSLNGIYCCDNPLSEWILLLRIKKNICLRPISINKIGPSHYEGSYYYLKESIIVKFDLSNFKTEAIGNYKTLYSTHINTLKIMIIRLNIFGIL